MYNLKKVVKQKKKSDEILRPSRVSSRQQKKNALPYTAGKKRLLTVEIFKMSLCVRKQQYGFRSGQTGSGGGTHKTCFSKGV